MQEIFSRLEYIDHLIRIKGTGSPADLARRVGVGERTIYEYLNLMKAMGAPIRFCRERRSYCYDRDGAFKTAFVSMEN